MHAHLTRVYGNDLGPVQHKLACLKDLLATQQRFGNADHVTAVLGHLSCPDEKQMALLIPCLEELFLLPFALDGINKEDLTKQKQFSMS